MKVLAFAATSSSKSINKQLVKYATSLINSAAHEIEIIDLNDFEMPLFSEDKEAEVGVPEAAHAFFNKITASDAIVISFAEHNGSYTVAYKNIFDWASRISMQVFQGKPMVMLATSPGPGGAASVLKGAADSSVYFNGKVVGTLSVPSFYDNFDAATGVVKEEALATELSNLMQQLADAADSASAIADETNTVTA
ncbi:NAD(P)H-dependent oxidoreductase [Halioxenophilus sp. WMMB6]|uniref:NADPH-dependent FMN reductase n=1 Tax=Halioxenophilus sp. WMMB6 TaxID=3073815 RepID=UPI00295E8892|nr:NAD(P)H-dependent oxidoreductase [Halioxenophilus sp. WMMB6]